MIAGIFHEGSGLGDQLFRYITVRTLAEEKGFEWGMIGIDNFKGKEFIDTAMHSPFAVLDMIPFTKKWNEKEIRDSNDVDIRSYDPEINFVEDNTIIDGSFEDDKYWGHNLKNINEWLAVDPLDMPDDLCVIGFRGGEYYTDYQLGLPPSYFVEAVEDMLAINPKMRFQVHTDDPKLAKQFFPNFEVVDNTSISHSKHTNMGFNWRSARYAKYAIIPNSAFFILPRILRHWQGEHSGDFIEGADVYIKPNPAVTIAPRYWARRNTKVWARPACYYKPFLYI